MGLHDDGRELSPLSDLDKVHKSEDVANHFNKSMKRSVTDTIRDHAGDTDDYYSDMPVVQIQKPAYIPVKRPDQAYNQKPKLGSKHKNRQGYHYEPIASTSRQSPTFIIDQDEDELILPIGDKYAWSNNFLGEAGWLMQLLLKLHKAVPQAMHGWTKFRLISSQAMLNQIPLILFPLDTKALNFCKITISRNNWFGHLLPLPRLFEQSQSFQLFKNFLPCKSLTVQIFIA